MREPAKTFEDLLVWQKALLFVHKTIVLTLLNSGGYNELGFT